MVKRGKREDFGQNGGNSWDLYRPSRDQRQERIPGGSTPRSAGRTCTHTHTRWLARSRTHAHTPLHAPPYKHKHKLGWLAALGGPGSHLRGSVPPALSCPCGLDSGLVWSLVRRVMVCLFFF